MSKSSIPAAQNTELDTTNCEEWLVSGVLTEDASSSVELERQLDKLFGID